MKVKVIEKSSLIGKIFRCWRWLLMPLMVMLIMPAAGWAGKYVTYEGTIQGILCVHDKELCHRENLDMYLALEPDFVIVFPDGNHFLLPNLDRHIKSKYLERNVRISGEQESESIWVDKLEVKEGDQYRQVWSWKQQQEMYKGGGG